MSLESHRSAIARVPINSCPLDVLGAGEFGEVYKAIYTSIPEGADGIYVQDEHYEIVAVKTLKAVGLSAEVNREDRDILMSEATVTAQFVHPNIVRLIGVVTIGTPLMIVLEICGHGELKKMVSRYELDADLKINLMHGIAKGMAHLAGLGYIHRDLASRNVLVSEEPTPPDENGEVASEFVPKVRYRYHSDTLPCRHVRQLS
jgi:serine/threonine protein kinase